ncbi:MAG: hypothetical protein ACRDVZ_16730, partial [Jiangellaceae bacterium]
RAAHQGPDVDGVTLVVGSSGAVGQIIHAHVVDTDGADLVAARSADD